MSVPLHITRLLLIAMTSLTFAHFSAAAAKAPSQSEKAAKTGKKQNGKVKIQHIRSGSEETRAERDRRLFRECKGRPNSGACAGYTQR